MFDTLIVDRSMFPGDWIQIVAVFSVRLTICCLHLFVLFIFSLFYFVAVVVDDDLFVFFFCFILANFFSVFFFYLELVVFLRKRRDRTVIENLYVCVYGPTISRMSWLLDFVYRDTKKPHPTASTTAVTATAGHIFGSCRKIQSQSFKLVSVVQRTIICVIYSHF